MIPVLGTVMLTGGLMAANATLASADTTTSATPTSQVLRPDIHKGGHVGTNGAKEELLTGDIASKVTAAALAAQPGATIERVETDAEGAAYEAHMTKADGSRITLKFDSDFNISATESGHGPHGR